MQAWCACCLAEAASEYFAGDAEDERRGQKRGVDREAEGCEIFGEYASESCGTDDADDGGLSDADFPSVEGVGGQVVCRGRSDRRYVGEPARRPDGTEGVAGPGVYAFPRLSDQSSQDAAGIDAES